MKPCGTNSTVIETAVVSQALPPRGPGLKIKTARRNENQRKLGQLFK